MKADEEEIVRQPARVRRARVFAILGGAMTLGFVLLVVPALCSSAKIVFSQLPEELFSKGLATWSRIEWALSVLFALVFTALGITSIVIGAWFWKRPSLYVKAVGAMAGMFVMMVVQSAFQFFANSSPSIGTWLIGFFQVLIISFNAMCYILASRGFKRSMEDPIKEDVNLGKIETGLERIRKAYDRAAEEFNQDISSLAVVPQDFKNSQGFKEFMENSKGCNTGNPAIREYLDPKPGMNFLDAGCGGGLVSYRLHDWPSLYYGIDLSPKLIEAMKSFVKREGIKIGGLWVSDLSSLPFPDRFFDIAACLGVFEYFGLPYLNMALKELNRVIKPGGKLVLDIPNQAHPYYPVMIRLEKYLQRPHVPFSREEFEDLLRPFFTIQKLDDSKVMIKYFLKA
jgi:ubiquinone/menaquinone biosynthesis C-methylase UbiE